MHKPLYASGKYGHHPSSVGRKDMTLKRMDNVLIVVEDLEAAKAFFVELGMELEGEMPVEGRWVDRVVGLENDLYLRLIWSGWKSRKRSGDAATMLLAIRRRRSIIAQYSG